MSRRYSEQATRGSSSSAREHGDHLYAGHDGINRRQSGGQSNRLTAQALEQHDSRNMQALEQYDSQNMQGTTGQAGGEYQGYQQDPAQVPHYTRGGPYDQPYYEERQVNRYPDGQEEPYHTPYFPNLQSGQYGIAQQPQQQSQHQQQRPQNPQQQLQYQQQQLQLQQQQLQYQQQQPQYQYSHPTTQYVQRDPRDDPYGADSARRDRRAQLAHFEEDIKGRR